MITFTDWLDTDGSLDELSRATLNSYKQKATNQRDIASGRSALSDDFGNYKVQSVENA